MAPLETHTRTDLKSEIAHHFVKLFFFVGHDKIKLTTVRDRNFNGVVNATILENASRVLRFICQTCHKLKQFYNSLSNAVSFISYKL